MTGIEPATLGTTNRCSTPELHPPLNAPRGIRTPDLRIRSPLLYPAELVALHLSELKKRIINVNYTSFIFLQTLIVGT